MPVATAAKPSPLASPRRDPFPLLGPAVVAPADDDPDPDHGQRDADLRTAVRPLAEEDHAQRDDPEGRRVLEVDRVGRGGRLDGAR